VFGTSFATVTLQVTHSRTALNGQG
jgi:hypothetical protein